jgi:hypothetical protein
MGASRMNIDIEEVIQKLRRSYNNVIERADWNSDAGKNNALNNYSTSLSYGEAKIIFDTLEQLQAENKRLKDKLKKNKKKVLMCKNAHRNLLSNF